MKVVVRPLETPGEFEQAEEVQMSAWGMGPLGAAPKEVMIAANDNGGVVLGAFEGRKMVGLALTLVGYKGGSVYMYSHMTGVAKGHQSKGIGYLIKQKQREICLQRGFTLIAWTFDPLIARNASFNVRKLGVIARNYLVDYYGPMQDSINAGWPTDRFLCEWYIRPDALRTVRAYGRDKPRDAHVVIKKRGNEPEVVCEDWDIDTGAEWALVDIPRDVVGLKARRPEDGMRWRTSTREIFEVYFAAGYSAVALLERSGSLQYLLTRADLPPNVFAEHR
jgi:predicted GNAT superfamily acetyltransferase